MFGLIMTVSHADGHTSTTTMSGFTTGKAADEAGEEWRRVTKRALGVAYDAIFIVVFMGQERDGLLL